MNFRLGQAAGLMMCESCSQKTGHARLVSNCFLRTVSGGVSVVSNRVAMLLVTHGLISPDIPRIPGLLKAFSVSSRRAATKFARI
jgi:hypothetical protein